MKQYIGIYLLSMFFLFTACEKNEPQDQDADTLNLATIDTLMIPVASQGLKPSLRLTPKAQEAVKDWSLYQSLSKRLDSLHGTTLGTAKRQLLMLISIFDGQKEVEEEDIIKLTPDNLETPAIKARLLSVETKLKIVNNYAQKSEPNAQEISDGVVELKNAFQNLNLQINENFALTIEEMLKQLNQEIEENKTNKTPTSDIENPGGKPSVKIYKPNQG